MQFHWTLLAAVAIAVTPLTIETAQPPVPQPAAPRIPVRNMIPPFFNPGEPAAINRTRSIKAAFRGQRIEIADRGGKAIRIKVTRTKDGQPVTEEFEAADAEILRTERPELGLLYDRLAGTR
ncbi:MAG TPA: hypothetical protein VM165_22605 [Planctomycetaceae bacterium]|nr:hypothetical protein [Planctomycetaceae bacterium]